MFFAYYIVFVYKAYEKMRVGRFVAIVSSFGTIFAYSLIINIEPEKR